MQKLLTLVKIALTCAALYIVYTKVDTGIVLRFVENAEIIHIIAALGALFLAQYFSALRMRFYLASGNIKCSKFFATALYLVAMLYSNLLPGGISGDGYKIYFISKLKNSSKLLLLRLILSDRANGLFILMMMAMGLSLSSTNLKHFTYLPALLLLFASIVASVYLSFSKFALAEKFATTLGALKYSFLVHTMYLFTFTAILLSMEPSLSSSKILIDYLIIFLISSIVAVIPISVGGAGLRELTFLYGATYLNLDTDIGIAASLVYFGINLLLSLSGLLFINNLKRFDKTALINASQIKT